MSGCISVNRYHQKTWPSRTDRRCFDVDHSHKSSYNLMWPPIFSHMPSYSGNVTVHFAFSPVPSSLAHLEPRTNSSIEHVFWLAVNALSSEGQGQTVALVSRSPLSLWLSLKLRMLLFTWTRTIKTKKTKKWYGYNYRYSYRMAWTALKGSGFILFVRHTD